MYNCVYIESHNIKIVNIWQIIESCYDSIYHDMDLYNLNSKQKINKDIKNIISHHVIRKISEFVISQKNNLTIVYFCDLNYKCNTICGVDVHPFFIKLLKKISLILPIRIFYKSNITYCIYTNTLVHKQQGLYQEYICNLLSFINSVDFTKFTFEKAQIFIKRNNLFFLNKHLFTELKAKQFLLV